MSFGDIAEKTRNPKESLVDENKALILKSNKEKDTLEDNRTILISGDNGTGKSTLALDLLCNDLKDDEMVIYISVDNSGKQLILDFFDDLWYNDNIKHLDTYASKTVIKDGKPKEEIDEEGIMDNVIAQATAIKELLEEGVNIKGVIIDGVSFLLEFAEARMRLEKNLSPDQGVTMAAWKIRNKYFREFYLPYMNLPISVIFVSHADFIEKPTDDDLSNVKKKFIDLCSNRIETYNAIKDNVSDFHAVIKKDRTLPCNVNSDLIFLSVNISKEMQEREEVFLEDLGEDRSEDITKMIFRKPLKKSKNPKSKKKSDNK